MKELIEELKQLSEKLAECCGSDYSGVETITKAINELEHIERYDKDCKEQMAMYRRANAELTGEITGLKFALRCNGISGAEVKE